MMSLETIQWELEDTFGDLRRSVGGPDAIQVPEDSYKGKKRNLCLISGRKPANINQTLLHRAESTQCRMLGIATWVTSNDPQKGEC